MDLTCEAKYQQLEEQHWWFASRRDTVSDLIKSLKLPRLANRLLQLVRAENRVLRRFNLPLGVSVFALTQKPV